MRFDFQHAGQYFKCKLGAAGFVTPDPTQLLAHILLVDLFDPPPVQMQFFGNVPNRRRPATATDKKGIALGVKQIVCQPRKLFAFHLTATPAQDASDLLLQVNVRFSAGQVPHSAHSVFVKKTVNFAANAAGCFFPRRVSRIIRALGSPKMPRTTVPGENPGKRYASWSL